jgi:hypothetical protein
MLFTISGERVVARLKKMLFSRIIKQEVAFFDVNKTGTFSHHTARRGTA